MSTLADIDSLTFAQAHNVASKLDDMSYAYAYDTSDLLKLKYWYEDFRNECNSMSKSSNDEQHAANLNKIREKWLEGFKNFLKEVDDKFIIAACIKYIQQVRSNLMGNELNSRLNIKITMPDPLPMPIPGVEISIREKKLVG